MTVVDEKVTGSPSQILVADEEIAMLTFKLGLTVMVSEFEEAGLPVIHNALEVN